MKKSAPEGVVADQGGRTWHAPAPAELAPWVMSYLARQSSGYCERFTIFPAARIELLFNFGSAYLTNSAVGIPLQPLAPASLFAPKWVRNEHQCGPGTDWFLVQLTLSGCFGLLGEGAADLMQQDRPLRELIGNDADVLWHTLAHEPSFDARCARFSQWAGHRVGRRTQSRISAFCELSRERAVASVAEAADRCDIGERRLRDIFRAELGVSPKRWLSIVRAERLWTALHPVSRASPQEWWEYADESHAHRDFKHWTGMTIGRYHAIKSTGDGLVNGGERRLVDAS